MNSPHRLFLLFLAQLLAFAALPPVARAARADGGHWPADGVPVANGSPLTGSPVLVTDGFGGTLAAWSTKPGSGDYFKVYINRVYPNGNLPGYWDLNGRAACTATGADELSPAIAADGAGGAIVAWLARGKVFAQRITGGSETAPGWPAAGRQVSTRAEGMTRAVVASDGAFGAYVAWQGADSLTGASDIYLQHLSADGTPLWQETGHDLVNTPAASETYPSIVEDGAGGVVVVWRLEGGQLCSSRVNADGFTVNGWDNRLILNVVTEPAAPAVKSDRAGGIYLATEAVAISTSDDIFAARVDATGNTQWSQDISPTDGTQSNPGIALDPAGNIIVAWEDERDGPSGDIYAQRVSLSGLTRWSPAAVPLCTQSALQRRLALVADGAGGAIALWADGRGENVYAQRVDSLGTVKWTPDGIPLTASNAVPQDHGLAVYTDSLGGAFVAWFDGRSTGPGAGVYEARVDSTGNTGTAAVAVGAVTAEAHEGAVRLRWSAFVSDAAEFQVLRATGARGGPERIGEILRARPGQQDYEIEDPTAEPGVGYVYRIEYREGGAWIPAALLRITGPRAAFVLRAPSPNPSRGPVRVEYSMARAGEAIIDVFDAGGSRVRRLVRGVSAAGRSSIEWDGRDDTGRLAPAGVYFVRLSSGESRLSRSLLRMP